MATSNLARKILKIFQSRLNFIKFGHKQINFIKFARNLARKISKILQSRLNFLKFRKYQLSANNANDRSVREYSKFSIKISNLPNGQQSLTQTFPKPSKPNARTQRIHNLVTPSAIFSKFKKKTKKPSKILFTNHHTRKIFKIL